VENEIEANMRLELTKSIEKDVNLTLIARNGIANLGNTCYANSIWQIIAHIKIFNDFLQNNQEHINLCTN